MSILSDDQIDYKTLPDASLRELVMGADFFVANSALATLAMRKSRMATELARHVLEQSLGDDYLQAAAINIFFDGDPVRASRFLAAMTESSRPYVFNTILELMVQNRDFFRRPDVRPIVLAAGRRIAQVPQQSKWPSIEVRDSFLASYAAEIRAEAMKNSSSTPILTMNEEENGRKGRS